MWHSAERHRSKSSQLNGTKASDTLETAGANHDPPVDKGKCAVQYLMAMFTIETIVWVSDRLEFLVFMQPKSQGEVR
jgi:hypothetical protein